jgi:hypothetical protein
MPFSSPDSSFPEEIWTTSFNDTPPADQAGLDAFGIADDTLRVRNTKLGGHIGNDPHRDIDR